MLLDITNEGYILKADGSDCSAGWTFVTVVISIIQFLYI